MPSPGTTVSLINETIIGGAISAGATPTRARTGDTLSNDAGLRAVHTRVKLGSDLVLVTAVDNAAKAGGAKLFDFPAGFVTIINARIEGSLGTAVADLTSTAGEIGLGTVVASGAAAVLGGTATFENILEGGRPNLGNFVAGADLAVKAGGTLRTASVGTFAAPAACFLNAASTWGNIAVAADVVARAGMIIDVVYLIAEA